MCVELCMRVRVCLCVYVRACACVYMCLVGLCATCLRAFAPMCVLLRKMLLNHSLRKKKCCHHHIASHGPPLHTVYFFGAKYICNNDYIISNYLAWPFLVVFLSLWMHQSFLEKEKETVLKVSFTQFGVLHTTLANRSSFSVHPCQLNWIRVGPSLTRPSSPIRPPLF